MVVEYIRYRIPHGRQERFEAAYRDAASSLDASDRCLADELSHGVEESERYILRIEWDSLEGREQGFRRSPELQPFFAAVRPWWTRSGKWITTTSRPSRPAGTECLA
jgi:heme-degrading monooxygenase HmoA